MTRATWPRRPRPTWPSSGIADTAYFGAEAEFYIFDSIRHETSANQAFYYIDSIEGAWNTGREEPGGNRGYKTALQGRLLPGRRRSTTTPTCATRWCAGLIDVGFTVERSHHEVGTAGQAEINYKFSTLLHAGDQIQLFKYIIKNTAWAARQDRRPSCRSRSSATTAPACTPTRASGSNGEPLFYDETGYAGLSDMARWYIGGLLHHAPSLLAFTNPTVNSYRRLVPGYEAPVNLVYSQRNRSACTRIPVTGSNAKAKRVEFRVPDPSCNPYLAFSAHDDGRPGRHQEQDRAAGPDRQGPLRPAAGGVGQRQAGAGLAAGRARRARGRPRVPAPPVASSPPT